MSDDLKLQQEVNKGHRAKLLLDDPILKEAFETLEAQLVKAWIATEAKAAIDRENAFRMIHAQRKVRDLLQTYLDNGKIADAQIKKALRERQVKAA